MNNKIQYGRTIIFLNYFDKRENEPKGKKKEKKKRENICFVNRSGFYCKFLTK